MTRRDVTDALFGLLIVLLLTVALWGIKDAVASEPCDTSRRTVIVDLDNQRHIKVLRHVWYATSRGRESEHLHIERDGADARRRAALRGIPTKAGFDRDEYPPAIAREGGAGASVRYIPASVNRSAGAVMGDQLEAYCDGQSFRFERRPRR